MTKVGTNVGKMMLEGEKCRYVNYPTQSNPYFLKEEVVPMEGKKEGKNGTQNDEDGGGFAA